MRQQYSSVCYMYYIILIYFIKSTNFHLAYIILYNFMQDILISNVHSIDM